MSITRRTLITTSAAALGGLAAPYIAQAQSANTVELWTFLDPNGRGVRAELLKEIISNFEKDNSGTSVKTNIIQWTEISPQLLRASKSGNVPDVVMLYSPYMASHVKVGTLAPLDPMMARWSQERRNDTIILPIAKDKANQTYALPWELRVYGLLYRLDLLKQAGLEPPKSLDDMANIAAALQKPSVQGLGLSLHPSTSTAPIEFIMPQMIAQGSKIIKEDGSASFNDPGSEKILQYVYDLVHKHKVLSVDTALMPSDDVQNIGIGGQVAMMMNGSHRLSTVQERSQGGAQWSFMAFPSLENSKPVPASLQGWTLAIPKKAKNPQLAWKLIEHWTSRSVQKEQAVRAGYLPTVKSVGSDTAFATGLNLQFRLPEVIEYVSRNPLNLDWPENSDVLNDAIGRMAQQVVTGKMSPKDALKFGEKTYNELRG